MRIIKTIFFSFFVLVLLSNPRLPAFSSPAESEENTALLDGGATVLCQNGFDISFRKTEGGLLQNIKLSASSVREPGRCLVFGGTVFLPDKNFCVGLSKGGEFTLFGGAVFDRRGNLLLEFSSAGPSAPEKTFPAEQVLLLGEEKLLIKSSNLCFVFDTKSGVCINAGAAFL